MKRTISIILALSMLLSMTGMTAFAQGGTPSLGVSGVTDSGENTATTTPAAITIIGFAALPETVMYQSVAPRTPLAALNLPDTLTAVVEDEADEGQIAVTWQPDSEYDETAETGAYTFTAVLPEGYTLVDGVALPEIYVMVGAQATTYAVNDTFTSETDDGHILTYKILTESDNTGTVQVGTGVYDPRNPAPNAISGTGSGSLTIPETVTNDGVTYTVTAIWNYAFYNCTDFTGNLIIPDSVTTIAGRAFYNCTGFTGGLTIPDKVTSIGDSAFYNCSGFKGGLKLGTSASASQLLTIGDYAFEGCKFTGGLVIPNKVTTIGNQAFQNIIGFTGGLAISDSVTSIGDSAFNGCTGFGGTLTLGTSASASKLATIGQSAFYGCTGFTGDLTIPNNVKTIGSDAFNGCAGLKGSLTISDGVTSIGNGAFANCGFTGTLTIPSKVTSIEDYTFMNCKFTGDLIIPDGITSIGNNAFYGCTGLTGTLNLGSAESKLATIGNTAFSNCGFTGDLVIPDSVTSIGNNAFYNCTGFNGTLTLGGADSKLTTIGISTFSDCIKLKGDLVIPDSVTSIEESAFDNCTGFNGTLTLGGADSKLTTIGMNAFVNCTSLKGDLVIPDSVTSIKQSAFNNCSNLQGALVVGSGVQAIENDAFVGTIFAKIYFLGGVPTIGTDALASDATINYRASKSIEWSSYSDYSTAPFTFFALTETSKNIAHGDLLIITPTITPSIYKGVPTWVSSDEAIATVDKDGKITTTGVGTTTITATLLGEAVTYNLTVTQGPSKTDPITVYNGTTATNTFAYGDTITVKFTPAVVRQPFSLTLPSANEAALFLGGTQLTAPMTATEGVECVITYHHRQSASHRQRPNPNRQIRRQRQLDRLAGYGSCYADQG